MTNMNISKSVIPNTITSLNLLSGFVSIVLTGSGDYKSAGILIIVAAIFDTLDGIVARLLKVSGRFGVELDSLGDVVSFGAAPAFLIYKSYLFHLDYWGVIISSCLLIFGALRLARFNIQLVEIATKSDFKGLPIPLSAITIAMLVITFHEEELQSPLVTYLVIGLIIMLSLLMVSKIRYNALPKLKNKKLKEKMVLFVALILALILVLVTNGAGLFYIFLSWVLFGILRHVFYLIFDDKKKVTFKEETN